MKRRVLAFAVTIVLGAAGVAAAGVLGGSAPPPAAPSTGSDKAEATEQDGGVHGGPIDRFHRAGSCDLTAVGSLPGNWTHGDYVSAVAAGGDAVEIREAARSDCGKPMVAVGHGGGPPDHALEHMAAGQAHAGKAHAGKAHDSGSDVSGS